MNNFVSTDQFLPYDQRYPMFLGRLVSNLGALELNLRVALYLFETPEAQRRPSSWKVASLSVGDEIETSPITSYDYLSDLVKKYNAHQTKAGLPQIDTTIVDLRNMLAHGLISSAEYGSDITLTAVKFGKPSGGRARITDKFEMTLDWIDQQVGRVHAAIITVHQEVDRLR